MSNESTVLGVYSLQKEMILGESTTRQKHDTITYWYARRLSGGAIEIQPLNPHHVPSGMRSTLKEIDFLRQYTPEFSYYTTHTVPALKTLTRKLREGAEDFSMGKLVEAERQFIKALMIDGLSVDANYGLGEVYSEQEDYAKLKQVLDTLVGLEDAFTLEYRQQFNSFGVNLRKNGHYDESIRYYKKSLEVIDTDENVFFNLARVYFEKGEKEECISCLNKAIGLNPDFVEAHKFMDYCQVKFNN